jgi:hypothetical protein
MLHPQIVVFEPESRVAPQLRELAASERWALREPRLESNCREQLQAITPTVLVLRIDEQFDRDMSLIAEFAKLPYVAIVVVGSIENAETLAGLAWDCGADFALFPPLSRDLLPEVVRGLMRRTVERLQPLVRAQE